MATPRTQKAGQRPISFLLQDLSNGSDITSVSLVIRPEELTRSEPSRLNSQQTLGGAWADNFGVGIRQVTISGHTGWRGGPTQDGMALFKELNDTVFNEWHSRRKLAAENGRDPEKVQLIFADLLDDFAYVVAPDNFTLRRSRSRPLLMQYQINMTVLSENLDDVLAALTPQDILGNVSVSEAISMLNELLAKIRGYAVGLSNLIDGTLGSATQTFMEMTADVLEVVTATVESLEGSIDIVASSLIGVAQNLTQAGRNIMAIVAAPFELAASVRQTFMEIGAAYSYAFCILKNAFNVQEQYPDYSTWYGASNCSALSGGNPASPLRHENPFYLLDERSSTVVTQTPAARAASLNLSQLDVMDTEQGEALASMVTEVNSGTTIKGDS